jgi:hypothetical protein
VLDLDSWKVDTRPSLPKSNGQNWCKYHNSFNQISIS